MAHMKQKLRNIGLIQFDTLDALAKRYGIILKAGFRDRDRISKALKTIDNIREKYGSGRRKTKAESIIRKWRDKR